MERVIDFLANHWMLSLAWLMFAALLMGYQKSKAGKSVTTHEATMLVNRSNAVILDIREKSAFDDGHIVDAINIPLAKLSERLSELKKKKEKPIVVVCQMGHQSGDAVKVLESNEFAQVSKLSGGMQEWQAQSLPVVKT